MEAVIISSSISSIVGYIIPAEVNPLLVIMLREILAETAHNILSSDGRVKPTCFPRKIIIPKYITMRETLEFLHSLYWRLVLYRESLKDAKVEKREERVASIQRKHKKYQAKKAETKMIGRGFHKCDCCQHYISPDHLHSQLEKGKYDALTLAPEVKISCPECDKPFASPRLYKLMDTYGVVSVKKSLKTHSDNLVYQNVEVLKREHGVKISEKKVVE